MQIQKSRYIISGSMPIKSKPKNSETFVVSPDTFETIFFQSPISTQILAPSGFTIKVNKAWEKLWGLTFEQIKDYNMLKDPQLIETGLMPYIKKGFKGEVVEIPPIRYEPGKTVKVKGPVPFRWVSAIMYPIKDKSGQLKKVVLQHQDITVSKEAEEKVTTSEQTLRLGLDAGKIGIWDWDIKSNSITWSDRIYEMHGLKKGTFDGSYEQYLEIIHPEDRNKVKNLVEQAMLNNHPYQVELRAILPNKQIRWLATNAQVIRDDSGDPVRMIGATYDVTERKDIEKQKDEFMAIVSHELKTPVTSLKAYAQILQQKFSRIGDETSSQQLGKMDAQINKLTSLISDLLDVTKIEAGKLKMQVEKFEFCKLVEEVIEEVQRTTEHHQIICKGKSEYNVFGDYERIGQALTNLLTNAIKYSPNSSTKKKNVVIKISENHGSIVCKVQDFGVGIAKEKQKLIFDRYYRESGSTERTFPGLGLGLYISAEIIKRHNGTIGVKSKKGEGSTFFFTLPIKR